MLTYLPKLAICICSSFVVGSETKKWNGSMHDDEASHSKWNLLIGKLGFIENGCAGITFEKGII